MISGETIFFKLNGTALKTTIKGSIFSGTSRYIPNNETVPWREVVLLETESGQILMRDRLRKLNRYGDMTKTVPAWNVGSSENILDALAKLISVSGSDNDVRLYGRASRSLKTWAEAKIL